MTDTRTSILGHLMHDAGVMTICLAIAADYRLTGNEGWPVFLIIGLMFLVNVGRTLRFGKTSFGSLSPKAALPAHGIICACFCLVLAALAVFPAATPSLQMVALSGAVIVLVGNVLLATRAFRHLNL